MGIEAWGRGVGVRRKTINPKVKILKIKVTSMDPHTM